MTETERIDGAIYHLKCARELLREVGAVRSLARIRLALSSTYGARRHAEGRELRPRPRRYKR